MESMGHVIDPTIEDAARVGFATEDMDTADIAGDIPMTASAILDTNEITTQTPLNTLHHLSNLITEGDDTINVVLGNSIRNEQVERTYFTSSFPTIFPYGSGKHLDPRRSSALSFKTWIKLMLRHSSRYIYII